MKRVIASLGLAVAMSGSAHAQTEEKQAFLCAEQDAVGFLMLNGIYERTGLKNSNFTIVKNGNTFTVKTGDRSEDYSCSKLFGHPDEPMICRVGLHFLIFNNKNLRFNIGRLYGPTDGMTNPDPLTVSYGTCQRF
jgi:hypothetical protein